MSAATAGISFRGERRCHFDTRIESKEPRLSDVGELRRQFKIEEDQGCAGSVLCKKVHRFRFLFFKNGLNGFGQLGRFITNFDRN